MATLHEALWEAKQGGFKRVSKFSEHLHLTKIESLIDKHKYDNEDIWLYDPIGYIINCEYPDSEFYFLTK
jgi:hypothetical protein